VFLDRTWRMHPAITGYVSQMFYDDRLESAPGLDRQRVQAPGRLSGAGLRWVPVEHDGCVADSTAEARVVLELVTDLLTGSWTDAQGSRAALTEQDVLVVAPYNAAVAMLRAYLPPGVRVGTVDKFQGQQAPVVVYSMTSSNAAVAPRGVDFLYDLHRFNVAISRAKALTVVVGSPALLDAAVHSPEQLRAVNALCRYVDLASGE
ncbi:MAG TPA: C-terminal helicase domain-containing protein, partial [Candidatus Lustribacter sp.]|nr:C-terminal helicase domain-containing protein [Candidatus Lustribacter sp.]